MLVLRQLIVWMIAVVLLEQAVGLSQPAYATPLRLQSLASTEIVQLLDLDKHKRSGKNNEYVDLATEVANKDSNVRELVFSDTDQFYEDLTAALKSEEPVNIITDYTSYSDFPARLKQIFKLDAYKVGIVKLENEPHSSGEAWTVPGLTPSPPVMTRLVAKIDYNTLIIPASTVFGTGVGAGIGGLAGGIGAVPGAFLGGAFGLAAGAVTVAIMDNNHEVIIEGDTISGKVKIEIRPISPESV